MTASCACGSRADRRRVRPTSHRPSRLIWRVRRRDGDDPRRRAPDRTPQRAWLAGHPRGLRHGSTGRPGPSAQRTARADHGAHAHLREPGHGRTARAGQARVSLVAAHRSPPLSQTRGQDPHRVSGLVAFVLAALFLVPALLVAIPVHEMGHAAAAYFQGDRSVRYFGYFTLDPRRFLDPLGVIAVFVALVGWGRRVPVPPHRISTTAQHLIHELGGPAANLIVAILLGLVWRLLTSRGMHQSLDLSLGLIPMAIYVIVFLNLSIFAFQLLPRSEERP